MISNVQSLHKTALFGCYKSLPTERVDGKSLVLTVLCFIDVFILMSTVHRVDKVLAYVKKKKI